MSGDPQRAVFHRPSRVSGCISRWRLPRTVIFHELENTSYACGCQLQRIGEYFIEELDYTKGVLIVWANVRGKWACRQYESLAGS